MGLCSNPLRAMFHPCVYSFWVPLADVTVSISRVLTDLIRCTGGARMHIFIIIAINGVLDCKCTIRECPAAKAACPGVEYQPRLKFFIRFLPINRRKIVPRRIFTKLYGQVFIASHKFLLVDKSHNQRVKRTRNSRAAYPCRYALNLSASSSNRFPSLSFGSRIKLAITAAFNSSNSRTMSFTSSQ